MDWTQFAIWLLTNTGFTLTLWLWNRSEANNDRRDMLNLMRSIDKEMKDFHGRLISLEERNRK